MAYGGPTPLFIVETPKVVWQIFSGDRQVRRVYMDVPHLVLPGLLASKRWNKSCLASSASARRCLADKVWHLLCLSRLPNLQHQPGSHHHAGDRGSSDECACQRREEAQER
jgi:hypothetical protein